jgi:hypothetical protein
VPAMAAAWARVLLASPAYPDLSRGSNPLSEQYRFGHMSHRAAARAPCATPLTGRGPAAHPRSQRAVVCQPREDGPAENRHYIDYPHDVEGRPYTITLDDGSADMEWDICLDPWTAEWRRYPLATPCTGWGHSWGLHNTTWDRRCLKCLVCDGFEAAVPQ